MARVVDDERAAGLSSIRMCAHHRRTKTAQTTQTVRADTTVKTLGKAQLR